MKNALRLLTFLAAFALLWSCARAGEKPNTRVTPALSSSESVEKVITDLEYKWADAIVKKDTAILRELIADDFFGTSWSGETYTKATAIKDIESGTFIAESLDVEGVNVRVFGDTAVVTLSQTEKSQYNKNDGSGSYSYSDVWVKRGGRWQAVSSFGFRMDTF